MAIRYVSLCSGIEAASVAWHRFGWEPVAFSEIDEFPSAVLAHRFPDVPNLGDVTKIDWDAFKAQHGDIDVLVAGTPCFPAGTLVLCDSGFKPIEEVEVGDKVVTHKGRVREVLRVGSKVSDTIVLKGQGSVGIECTPDHPFYSREKHRVWDNARREHLMERDEASEWRCARDMEGKFWLNVCNVESLPIPQFPEHVEGERGKGRIENFEFTDGFFYFVGRWLGDGWANVTKRKERKESSTKRVYVCSSHSEADDLQAKLDESGLHFGRTDSGTVERFTCNSTQLYDWLVGNFGVHADGKNISAWCYGMSESFRSAMLRGYLDADGTKAVNGYKSTTINRKLSVGMKMLAGSLGMATSVTLSVNNREAIIDGRRVNEHPNYVSSHYASSRSAFFADSGFYGLVRKIEKGRDGVRVYNLEVEDDNSFTADGIAVHNCQSFSVAGKREGLSGESRLMFEFIRAVRELRPRCFLWENVPGALSVEKGAAFGQLVREMDDIGYGQAWRVLDAQFARVPVRDDSGLAVGYEDPVAQRRRRVFLVGFPGEEGAERACQVLFEPESVQWDFETGRRARERLASEAGRGPEMADGPSGGRLSDAIGRKPSNDPNGPGYSFEVSPTEAAVDRHAVSYAVRTAQTGANGIGVQEESAHTLDTTGPEGVCHAPDRVAYALKTDHQSQNGKVHSTEVSPTLDTASAPPCAVYRAGCGEALCFKGGQGSGARSMGLQSELSQTLCGGSGGNQKPAVAYAPPVVMDRSAYNSGRNAKFAPVIEESESMPTLTARGPGAVCTQFGEEVAGTLLAEGADASPTSNGGQNVLCIASAHANAEIDDDLCPTQTARQYKQAPIVVSDGQGDVFGTMCASDFKGIRNQDVADGKLLAVRHVPSAPYIVRRITPLECERLQGFPSVVELEPEKMTADEMIACSLASGDILCDLEAGKVYGTRGPGGMRPGNPRELGSKHPDGYVYVSICCAGVEKRVRAHRIVYIAAYGGIPEGAAIGHVNGVKDDDRLCNLQALAPEDGGACEGDGDSPGDGRAAPYEIRREIAYRNTVEGASYKDLAIGYGVGKGTVGNIVHERGWTDLTGFDADAVAEKVAGQLGYDDAKRRKLVAKCRKWAKETPDGPRYKAVGNSMAVNCMAFLGDRIGRVLGEIDGGSVSCEIACSDCLEHMRAMPDDSIDAIVTDPPYGLSFMSKDWDTFSCDTRQPGDANYKTIDNAGGRSKVRYGYGSKFADAMRGYQEHMVPIFAEALRVAKPGAHLLCFGGTRTFHRTACAIEDAGWEIRDTIMWVYGCLDEETEILVDGEFVPYDKAGTGSLALGYDIATGSFSWQRIEDTYLYDYDDTAYAIQSDYTDQLVSRNHRCIVERGGVEQFALAEQVAREREASVPVLEDVPRGEGGKCKFTPARVTPVRYKGKMWCVKVATGAFVARRHGKIFVTGNSGFPKSMNVSKAIDKALGAERRVVGSSSSGTATPSAMLNHGNTKSVGYANGDGREYDITEPASDEARQWDGWGTCLKPAWEPIIVARKPLDGTVANNVLKYGTGAIDIDGCRVGNEGRFPANLVHDGSDEVLELFPDTGKSSGGRTVKRSGGGNVGSGKASELAWTSDDPGYGDFGSAARFFYCAKASKKDRGEGNSHPTVKPTALMEWLVKMVAREGQTVLDPFMGSGTTLVACKSLGVNAIGIDSDESYCDIARSRLDA